MLGKFPVKQKTAGYTLTEMIAVLVIIGVLAAIAAPGWLAFVNSRRANAASDQILQTLRQAQADALRTRQSRVVEFDVDADPPVLTFQQINTPLGDGTLSPTMMGMEVTNGGADPNNLCPDANCIAFGADGTVLNPITDDAPIIITAFAPRDTGTSRRCIIVRTLLGTMQSATGDACEG